MRNNLKEVGQPLELQVFEPEKNRLTLQLNQNSNPNSNPDGRFVQKIREAVVS